MNFLKVLQLIFPMRKKINRRVCGGDAEVQRDFKNLKLTKQLAN